METEIFRVPLTRRRFLGTMLPLAAAFAAACSGKSAPTGALVARPADEQWPALFQQAAPEVQEAYRYALANPDVLQYFPCYCGCAEDGHRSNKDCYLRETRPDGYVVLDPMSFG